MFSKQPYIVLYQTVNSMGKKYFKPPFLVLQLVIRVNSWKDQSLLGRTTIRIFGSRCKEYSCCGQGRGIMNTIGARGKQKIRALLPFVRLELCLQIKLYGLCLFMVEKIRQIYMNSTFISINIASQTVYLSELIC